MKKHRTSLIMLCVALLLPAAAALAADGDRAGTVNFIDNATQVKNLRSGETVRHLQKVAEDLRLLQEAQAKGLPMPELATRELTPTLKNGLQGIRLGALQMETLSVFFGEEGTAAVCQDPAAFRIPESDELQTTPEFEER